MYYILHLKIIWFVLTKINNFWLKKWIGKTFLAILPLWDIGMFVTYIILCNNSIKSLWPVRYSVVGKKKTV